MARLDHPHIVRTYGGCLSGPTSPLIVTELCECSLSQVLDYYRRARGSGLPLHRTLTLGLQVASALWHLHPSIVHRDLK
jgi:serine/threonine protein kinase